MDVLLIVTFIWTIVFLVLNCVNGLIHILNKDTRQLELFMVGANFVWVVGSFVMLLINVILRFGVAG